MFKRSLLAFALLWTGVAQSQSLCTETPELQPIRAARYAREAVPLTLEYAYQGNTVVRESQLFLPTLNEKVPLVIFLPGGTVDGDRYDWLGNFLASQGFATVIVQKSQGSTFDKLHWIQATLNKLRDSSWADRIKLDQIILGGHSFGGVCVLCINDKASCNLPIEVPELPAQIVGSFVLNSHMQPAADPNLATDLHLAHPMLMIYGTQDGLSKPDQVLQSFKRLHGKGTFSLVSIPGANHFQSIDCVDPGKDNVSKDLAAEISHQEAINAIGENLLGWLNMLVKR